MPSVMKYPNLVYKQEYRRKGKDESAKDSDSRERDGSADDSLIDAVKNWQQENNIKSGSDSDASATVNLNEDDESYYLIAHDFQFALTKTVRGIEVEYRIKSNTASTVKTMDLMLTLNAQGGGAPFATPIGVNKATSAWWPNGALEIKTAGGSADLWGYAFTKELLNQSGFGVMLKVENLVHDGVEAKVDFIRVTVHHDA